MNRYTFTNLNEEIKARRYYCLCGKCGFLHWDDESPCPTPTQTSLDLKNGVRRDLQVLPFEEWEGGRINFAPFEMHDPDPQIGFQINWQHNHQAVANLDGITRDTFTTE